MTIDIFDVNGHPEPLTSEMSRAKDLKEIASGVDIKDVNTLAMTMTCTVPSG